MVDEARSPEPEEQAKEAAEQTRDEQQGSRDQVGRWKPETLRQDSPSGTDGCPAGSLTRERMAASMWRMNGLWRRMAGVLVLCALLLSSEVKCQDDTDPTDPTVAPAADPSASAAPEVAGSAAAPAATDAPDAGAAPTAAPGDAPAPSAAPGDFSHIVTIIDGMNIGGSPDAGASGTTAAPVGRGDAAAPAVVTVETVKYKPDVKCVGKDDIAESNAVKVEVTTDGCEATKRVIDENLAVLCETPECVLKIFQDDKMALIASDNAPLRALADVVQGEHLKDKLGVTKVETPSSSGSSVFVGILVSGLLAALGIIVGYFKCQRRTDTKGVRLAEEAYPADQENQGNTLVSVAPLNPPPETTEKPSVNGESPEAAKTQPPPPTNGHSTAKTADTEL